MKKKNNTPAILKLIGITVSALERINGKWAVDFAYRLFGTPVSTTLPQREKPILKKAWQKLITVGSKKVMTYEWGSGTKQILLVHGWSGRPSQFHAIIDILVGQGYRVVSLDFPAHNKSNGKTTNILEISDSLLAIQKVHGQFDCVVSHSFGGVCTLYAQTQGLVVRKLISISMPANMSLLLDEYLGKIKATERTKFGMIDKIKDRFGVDLLDMSGDKIARGTSMPLHIIHDEEDQEASIEHAADLVCARPDADFHRTKGLGHVRILRDEKIVSLIAELVELEMEVVLD